MTQNLAKILKSFEKSYKPGFHITKIESFLQKQLLSVKLSCRQKGTNRQCFFRVVGMPGSNLKTVSSDRKPSNQALLETALGLFSIISLPSALEAQGEAPQKKPPEASEASPLFSLTQPSLGLTVLNTKAAPGLTVRNPMIPPTRKELIATTLDRIKSIGDKQLAYTGARKKLAVKELGFEGSHAFLTAIADISRKGENFGSLRQMLKTIATVEKRDSQMDVLDIQILDEGEVADGRLVEFPVAQFTACKTSATLNKPIDLDFIQTTSASYKDDTISRLDITTAMFKSVALSSFSSRIFRDKDVSALLEQIDTKITFFVIDEENVGLFVSSDFSGKCWYEGQGAFFCSRERGFAPLRDDNTLWEKADEETPPSLKIRHRILATGLMSDLQASTQDTYHNTRSFIQSLKVLGKD